MDVVALIGTLWLGSLFAYTAGMKFVDIRGFQSSLARYKVVRSRTPIAVAAWLLVLLEAATAVLLLDSPGSRLGAGLAVSLGAMFAAAAVVALRRGVSGGCGCSGKTSAPTGGVTVARAAAISGVGLLLIVQPVSRPGPALGVAVLTVGCVPAVWSWCISFRAQRRLVERRRLTQELVARHVSELASRGAGARVVTRLESL